MAGAPVASLQLLNSISTHLDAERPGRPGTLTISSVAQCTHRANFRQNGYTTSVCVCVCQVRVLSAAVPHRTRPSIELGRASFWGRACTELNSARLKKGGWVKMGRLFRATSPLDARRSAPPVGGHVLAAPEVNLDFLVDALMRMKGPAMGIDLQALIYKNDLLLERVENLSQRMDEATI